ncbi:MAG: hypothetical protein Q9160_002710 [Pyrenula sp. 1 TL-2023]
MQIGQQYYLNVQELMGGSMDMVTGTDANGNDTVHLGFFNPLISSDNGKARFVLVCLVNVTNFVQDAANESDSESVPEEADKEKAQVAIGEHSQDNAQAAIEEQDEVYAQIVLEDQEEEEASEIEYNLNDMSPMSSPDWGGPPTMPVEYFNLKLEDADRDLEEVDRIPKEANRTPDEADTILERANSLSEEADRFLDDDSAQEDTGLSWTQIKSELHAEDLLKGCILPSDRRKQRPTTSYASETKPSWVRPSLMRPINTTRSSSTLPTVPGASPISDGGDFWLSLIDGDHQRSQQRLSGLSNASTPRPPSRKSQISPRPTPTRTPRPSSSRLSLSSTKASKRLSKTPTHLDDILNTFMSSLQRLYSSIFILSLSPLSSAFYEIQFVSPALNASGSHVDGHLRHSSREVLKEMGEKLDGGERFRIMVKWGDDGVEMQCYCVPIWGRRINSWICVLVDLEEGMLCLEESKSLTKSKAKVTG